MTLTPSILVLCSMYEWGVKDANMANAPCEVGLRFESDGLSMGTVDEGKGFGELAQLAPQLILCVCTDRPLCSPNQVLQDFVMTSFLLVELNANLQLFAQLDDLCEFLLWE
ncbi:hypothetical protein Tco_0972565 [Tanacetum coccineum]